MKNSNKINWIVWRADRNDEISSLLNGFTIARPQDPSFIPSIKKQLRILENNKYFHERVNQFREENDLKNRRIPISEIEMNDRNLVLRNVNSLSCSAELDHLSVSLAVDYLQGELPLSFSTYIVYDFFPIEDSLLGLSFYKKSDAGGETMFVELHRRMGVTEFKKQIDILWPHIYADINELEKKEFIRDNGTLPIDEMIYQYRTRPRPLSYKKIQEILNSQGEYLTEETLRKKFQNYKKKVENKGSTF
jgi:hypothetical protein